jgi:hypothetical protein
MRTLARRLVGTTLIASTLALGAPAPAMAQVEQDGLVNVFVGESLITVEDVNVAVAANIAATLCDIDVGPLALAVLGQAVAVDRSGKSRTICTTDQGPVTIRQN